MSMKKFGKGKGIKHIKKHEARLRKLTEKIIQIALGFASQDHTKMWLVLRNLQDLYIKIDPSTLALGFIMHTNIASLNAHHDEL